MNVVLMRDTDNCTVLMNTLVLDTMLVNILLVIDILISCSLLLHGTFLKKSLLHNEINIDIFF